MIAVQSSNVTSVGYESDTRTLLVRFKSGDLYKYRNVPPEVYKGLLMAESVGKYLNQHIKKTFKYEKVESSKMLT